MLSSIRILFEREKIKIKATKRKARLMTRRSKLISETVIDHSPKCRASQRSLDSATKAVGTVKGLLS